MTTPRCFLGEINSNIIPHKDLSLYIRGKIIRKIEENKKPAYIAKELKIPKSTIKDIITNNLLRDKRTSRFRPSRPDKYSDRFKHKLIVFVRKEPKISIAKIRKVI
jgi:CENP-B N-terminal DNA-binding domain